LVVSCPVYLQSVRWLPERVESTDDYPFSLHVLQDLDVRFQAPVTFFVGENGSGKSTLLEAIAELAGLPVKGGGRNFDVDPASSALAKVLRPSWIRKPRAGWFFRADRQIQVGEAMASRGAHHVPGYLRRGAPPPLYADRQLEHLSHGEAFLALLNNRASTGLLLLDEPESALSPQRQLSLLSLLHRIIGDGDSQVICATHSPILMTYPGARLLSFDGQDIEPIDPHDTSHHQITQGMLENPARYWRYLVEDA
jgi:predicted ATPase